MRAKIIIGSVLVFAFSSCSFEKIDTENTFHNSINEYISRSGDKQTEEKDIVIDENLLEGIWHASAVMPASWSFRYCFRADGTYIFLNSTMINENRELGYSGGWKIIDNKLIITKTEKIIIEGGTPVEYLPGMNIIEGGIEAKISIEPPEIIEYAIFTAADSVLSDDIGLKTLFFGENQYWKYEEYSEEDIYK